MTEEQIFEHMRTLETETRHLVKIRNEFGRIYEYYFPASWVSVFKRMLGLSPQPDFALHSAELARIKDESWDVIERAKAAYQAIQSNSAPDRDIKDWAELAYKQIYLDGSSMMIFREFCVKMQANDPEAMRFMSTFRAWARDSSTNMRLLDAKGSTIVRGRAL